VSAIRTLRFILHLPLNFNFDNRMMNFALTVFSIINVIGLLMSVVSTLNPEAGIKMGIKSSGIDLPSLAKRDKETESALKYYLGFSASQIFGLNALSLLIVWIPFRNVEVWAWYAMWYWPLMFIWHYIHYTKTTPMSKMQLVWLALSVAALFLTYAEFFCEK
jgi:hypothetical protein